MPSEERERRTVSQQIGGKWKLELLYAISHRSVRWKTLIHSLPHAAPNVLTRQLRQLEEDGLVIRHVISENPPQVVEYELSAEGKTLLPLLEELHKWGDMYAAG